MKPSSITSSATRSSLAVTTREQISSSVPESSMETLSQSPTTTTLPERLQFSMPPTQPRKEEGEEESEKHDPRGCLFVASLSITRSDQQLHQSVTELFGQFGPLATVKVLKDWAGRPYAFVQFCHAADADRALREAQRTQLDGRRIRIERAKVNRTLFVGRFSRYASRQEILAVLERFGPVEDFTLLTTDGGQGESRGCGFVRYRYREDAIDAFMSMRAHSHWTVEWAENSSEISTAQSAATQSAAAAGDALIPIDIDPFGIFVGNLPSQITTEQQLLERFSRYGRVESVRLFNRQQTQTETQMQTQMHGKTNSSFAFIRYEHETEAERAILSENNSEWLGSVLRVKRREISDRRGGDRRSRKLTAQSSSSSISFGSGGGGWQKRRFNSRQQQLQLQLQHQPGTEQQQQEQQDMQQIIQPLSPPPTSLLSSSDLSREETELYGETGQQLPLQIPPTQIPIYFVPVPFHSQMAAAAAAQQQQQYQQQPYQPQLAQDAPSSFPAIFPIGASAAQQFPFPFVYPVGPSAPQPYPAATRSSSSHQQ